MIYLGMIFGSIFLTNILLNVLVGFPFISEETKVRDILIVGLKTLLLSLVATVILYPIHKYLIEDWSFITPILAVLIIMNLNLLSNFILDKLKLEKYTSQTYNLYVPVNAVVISTLLIMVNQTNYLGAIATTVGLSLGYVLVSLMILAIKPRLNLPGIPKSFKGIPLLLITLGLIGMVFVGLAGIL